ncbi:MAG: nuclear transport factor 2 family protein [Sphingomonadales bacterium]|nr:nuclear transport factor 2 family protein [Sphingomonadales bacterium]
MTIERGHATAAGDDHAADRAAILQLEAEYLLALDWGDAESYAALFAPEGRLDWAGGSAVGPAAIFEEMSRYKEVVRQIYGTDEAGNPLVLRHFITNQAIYIHGETAKGVIYWFEMANNGPGGAPVIGSYGHYEDAMRKVDGAWKFVSRTIFNEQVEGRKAGSENPARAARLP